MLRPLTASSTALPHRGQPLSNGPVLLYVPMGKGGKREKGVSRRNINAHVQQSKRRGGLNLVPELPQARPLPYPCRLCHSQLQGGLPKSSQGESSIPSSDSESIVKQPVLYSDGPSASQRTSISKPCPSCGAYLSSKESSYPYNNHGTRMIRLENGGPQNYLGTEMLDPFGTATVPITEDMNINIRHSECFMSSAFKI